MDFVRSPLPNFNFIYITCQRANGPCWSYLMTSLQYGDVWTSNLQFISMLSSFDWHIDYFNNKWVLITSKMIFHIPRNIKFFSYYCQFFVSYKIHPFTRTSNSIQYSNDRIITIKLMDYHELGYFNEKQLQLKSKAMK